MTSDEVDRAAHRLHHERRVFVHLNVELPFKRPHEFDSLGALRARSKTKWLSSDTISSSTLRIRQTTLLTRRSTSLRSMEWFSRIG